MISDEYYVGIGLLSAVVGGTIGDLAMNCYSVCPDGFDARCATDLGLGVGSAVLSLCIVKFYNNFSENREIKRRSLEKKVII